MSRFKPFHRKRDDREGESEPPIPLTPQRKVSIPLLTLISLIGLTITATIGWTALQADVRAATLIANSASQTASQHEERLRALEKSQTQIAEALDWIKRRMEEDRRPGRE